LGFLVLLVAFAANSNWLLQAQHNFAAGVGFATLGVALSALALWLFVDTLANQGIWVVFVLVLPQVCLGAGSWWVAYRANKTYEACAGNAYVGSNWQSSLMCCVKMRR